MTLPDWLAADPLAPVLVGLPPEQVADLCERRSAVYGLPKDRRSLRAYVLQGQTGKVSLRESNAAKRGDQ